MTGGGRGPGRDTLHNRVRERLVAMIASGAYPVGSTLPPFRTLARELGVTLSPLQRAAQDLVAEGILQTRQGSGTRVAALPAAPDEGALAPPPTVSAAAARHVVGVFANVGLAYDANHWKHRIVTAVERELSGAGRRGVLYNGTPPAAGGDVGRAAAVPLAERVRRALADGITAAVILEGGDAEESVYPLLLEHDIVSVWVQNRAPRNPVHSVYYYSDWAGYQAAAHLLDVGCRRLLFPLPVPLIDGGTPTNWEWMAQRFGGACRAAAHRGDAAEVVAVPVPNGYRLCEDGGLHPDGDGWRVYGAAVWRALSGPLADHGGEDGPVGVIAANDETALGLLDARDADPAGSPGFALVAFDNLPPGRERRLSTVEPPLDELGREAAALLLCLLAEGQGATARTVQHLRIRPTLIVRDTVLPPRTRKENEH